MSRFRLDHKSAIVTGGGSGIGCAIVKLLAEQGAKVFIFDQDPSAARTAEAFVKKNGGTAHSIQCDVSKAESVQNAVDHVLGIEEKIDILINSAGVAHIGNIEKTEIGDMTRLFNVNILGVYNCMKSVVIAMKGAGGVIVNIASVAASLGIQDRFAYSMSKGAVLSMTLSVARDYVNSGIRCNCVSPARIHTPFVDNFLKENYPGRESEVFAKLSAGQPIGRMGTSDEVAALVLFLCSEESSFITGSDYSVDGGFIKLR